MKRKIVIFLILIGVLSVLLVGCLPGNLNEGNNVDPRNFTKNTDYLAFIYKKGDISLPYRLYVPEAEEGKTYPILIIMHGSGECGINNSSQIYNKFYSAMKDYQATEKCYILLPQADKNKNWDYYIKDSNGDVVTTMLDDVLSRYADINPARQYVGGLSLGGFGTVSQLLLHPGRYAAAFSMCGGFSAAPNAEDYKTLAKTPLLLAHAEDDQIVPFRNSEDIFNNVTTAGGEVRLERLNGLKHNIWNQCFETKEYWDWLFSHVR